MELKKNIRAKNFNKVFIALPESLETSKETLFMIENYFQSWNKKPPNYPKKNLHPLDYAGCLIPEDLLLLQKKNRKWLLTAGSLYFPAHWHLSEKISKKLASIHQPVPHYKKNLEKVMDKFFDNMILGPISTRRNWTIQIDNNLFVPDRIWEQDLKSYQVPKRIFIREEYQTLRKLPQTNSILFTIRTHMWPISTWQKNKKALIELKNLFLEMSSATRKYRGVKFYGEALNQWVNSLN